MKGLVFNQDDVVGPWVCARAGGQWLPGRGSTIGLAEDGELIAGAIYDLYTKTNVFIHLAGEGKRWMTRDFLFVGFDYPFNQLGVKRVSGLVESTNTAARRLNEHLGWKLEAALKDGCENGDLLVYRMYREECRWLNLRSQYNGQTISAAAA